jgi:hypothetical protein
LIIDRPRYVEKRLQAFAALHPCDKKQAMTYTIADVEAIVAKAKGRPKVFAGLLDSEMGARPFRTGHHVPQELKLIPSRTLPLASDDHPSNSTFHWAEGRSHHLRFAPPPPPRRLSNKTKNKTKNIVLRAIVLAALLAAAATVYLLMPAMYVNDYYSLLSTPSSFLISFFSAGFSPFGGSGPAVIANRSVDHQSSSSSLLSTPPFFFISFSTGFSQFGGGSGPVKTKICVSPPSRSSVAVAIRPSTAVKVWVPPAFIIKSISVVPTTTCSSPAQSTSSVALVVYRPSKAVKVWLPPTFSIKLLSTVPTTCSSPAQSTSSVALVVYRPSKAVKVWLLPTFFIKLLSTVPTTLSLPAMIGSSSVAVAIRPSKAVKVCFPSRLIVVALIVGWLCIALVLAERCDRVRVVPIDGNADDDNFDGNADDGNFDGNADDGNFDGNDDDGNFDVADELLPDPPAEPELLPDPPAEPELLPDPLAEPELPPLPPEPMPMPIEPVRRAPVVRQRRRRLPARRCRQRPNRRPTRVQPDRKCKAKARAQRRA